MPKLIINADDFGLSPGTNEAILSCIEKRAITSTSLVVTGEAFKEGVESLQKIGSHISLGLHFVLHQEKPASKPTSIPTLVNERGNLWARNKFIKKLFSGKISSQDLKTELENQLKIATKYELKISHLDSHAHLQIHPKIYKIMSQVAIQQNIKRIRKAYEPFRFWPKKDHKSLAKYAGFALSNLIIQNISKNRSLKSPDSLLGIGLSGYLKLDHIGNYFKQLSAKQTYELMTHPGTHNAIDQAYKLYDRRGEYELLISPKFKELLKKYQIDLISYHDL
ncbi:carbohydrate deacetylase [Candidatus Auribacterota bacterium]